MALILLSHFHVGTLAAAAISFFLSGFSFCFSFFFFLAALGLRCYVQSFSSCSERGLLFVAVSGLLIEVASLVEEHGL